MKQSIFAKHAPPDYEIPEYSFHPINLDREKNFGRGVVVYTHNSIDKSVVQITPDDKFEETCLLEVKIKRRGFVNV